MDRMSFVPGAEARDEIFKAAGHIFFQRSTATAYADEFLTKAPVPITGVVWQIMQACMSEGDQVDIWFGLREPDTSRGQEVYHSGEPVGHTWAIFKMADGREKCLWEVGRATPAISEAHAARAFNAYREAFARFKDVAAPDPVAVDWGGERVVAESDGQPTISHALSPANLYYGSSRMWYFVDLGLEGERSTPVRDLSRPVRAFDALILAALMTLVKGTPPLVFGIANSMRTLGQMPSGYLRATYEADETLERPDDLPLVVL